MSSARRYRLGTTSVDVGSHLGPDEVGRAIHAAVSEQLSHTDESLGRFDFGPPRRSDREGMHAYDVSYATGPGAESDSTPAARRAPPQLGP